MKKTSKLSRFFKFLWLTHDTPISMDWDRLLNHLLEFGKVTDMSDFTITFNDRYEVWIENHPFSSGNLHMLGGEYTDYAVTKETRIKLEDFVNALETDKQLIMRNELCENLKSTLKS